MNILQEGRLKERVKSGEVSAIEARQALVKLRQNGEIVGEQILRWLVNFRPRKESIVVTKQRRKKRRKQEGTVQGTNEV